MKRYTGFEVHTIGDFYDTRQNPLFKSENEAQGFLIDYLGIKKRRGKQGIFAGTKDDRQVILMSSDKPATLRHLTRLYVGFESFYDTYDKRIAKHPDRPVEKILIVCMFSHHPRLADALQHRIPYPLDIEVIDVDYETFRTASKPKSTAEFSCGKKPSDGTFDFGEAYLIIENYSPMYLLEKLGIKKEDVGDWRSFCASVSVDFNFDVESGVMHVSVIDIPRGEGGKVVGHYQIPDTAGDTFLVKLVDLVDEPLYMIVKNEVI